MRKITLVGRGAVVLCVLALLVPVAMTGCASTPQHRSAGEVIDDVSLHARVKTALIDADDVDANEVNVEVSRGYVTLLGHVSSNAERRAATRVVQGVTGVRGVNNQLRLKSELE